MRQEGNARVDRLPVTPEQLRLISFGPRQDIIAALANDSDLSAGDLAKRLKRPVTGLYRHLDLLEAAGLIQQTGHRPGSNRPEALYALRFRIFVSDEAVRTPEGRVVFVETAARFASAAARRIRRAVADDTARIGVADANIHMGISDLQLDRAGLVAFQTLLQTFLADARKLRVPASEAQETIALTVLVGPRP